jgi:AcrR family transcriptional regulator
VAAIVQNRNPQRARELLEICFQVFCENGLENTGMQKLAEACGLTKAGLIYYFGSKDELVVQATAHCMAKVEDDFMARAPENFADIERFLREMPYITAELHGAKYRFMYQVYASPKYREYGREFFRGVGTRYHKYAQLLSGKLQLPADYIQGMTYLFVRACVHYALFEDQAYLDYQLNAIRASLQAFLWAAHQKKDDEI